MRTTSFLSVIGAPLARRTRRPRLANGARFAKRNRPAAALLCALTLPAVAHATVIPDAWHLGPAPAVRTLCHAGDTLWVGTASGLFLVDIRDGSIMRRIEAGEALPSSSVRDIAVTSDSVFVATDDGLALFRGGDVATYTTRDPGGLPAVPLEGLHGVSIGRGREVLLATLGHGAGVITAAGGYAITRSDSLMDDIVFDVRDTPDGARYFATNAGLCAQLDDTTFAWYQAGTGLPRGETRQLTVSPDGALYVLVSRIGVYRFDHARALKLPAPEGVVLADAHSLSIGPDGTLWVAGRGWIVQRRGSEWHRVDTRADAGKSWMAVKADGAGAFAGSEDGTVVAIGRGSPLHLDLGGGLPVPRVAAIAPDGSGGAWFVCGGRLLYADARTRRVTIENIPADVRAVTVDADGAVVTAGRWTVRRRGGNGWRDLKPDVTGADPAFSAARYDADGALWVGTRAGDIYRFDGDIWMRMARGSQTLDGGGIADVRSAPGGAWAVGAGIPVRCAEGRVQRFAGFDSTESVVDLERGPGGQWIAITPTRLYAFDDDANIWRRTGALELVGGRGHAEIRGLLTALVFDGSGALYLGSSEGLGVATAQGVRWLRAADGLGGGSVAGLALDGEHLWVGFARDGMTVLPLDRLR